MSGRALTNMELVHLVTEAYDAGFRDGFLYSDYGGYEDVTMERLTDPEYLGRRDNWVRERVPEGTTVRAASATETAEQSPPSTSSSEGSCSEGE